MSSRRKLSESEAAGCVLVSACLLGRACRYDGATGGNPALQQALAALQASGANVVGVCPEELGGLGTPRPAATLDGGDGAAAWSGQASVRRNHDGADVTAAFLDGARRARAAAGPARPTRAILKARSPSCGVGRTWRDGAVQDGDGVFAALLRAEGVPLMDDEVFAAPALPTPPPDDAGPPR